jgi:shikimate dehydrogenase
LAEGPRRLSGTTHTVGIIGWPVSHSLSPAIHNAAFQAMDMDWIYLPLPVEPGLLAPALEGLAALGFAGANVTMPHKTEAARLVDSLSEDAERLGAVNTVVVEGGKLHGHDTDVGGFDRFLRRDAGFDPASRSALIFGAGGAARACALALARGGVATATVIVRDPERASMLVGSLSGFDVEVNVATFGDVAAEPGRFSSDLIVNATPLGAAGEELPLPELGSGNLVVDLLYAPVSTPLQSAAKEAGAASFGGLGLLLHQASLSFELWTGQQPLLSAMSAAAVAVLSEPAERP